MEEENFNDQGIEGEINYRHNGLLTPIIKEEEKGFYCVQISVTVLLGNTL
jgi:hypothetical protein